ncbi:MAG: CcdB family protein [Chitinophagaceae bacterium]|nr:CcdB family protein [Polaromonas sp.]
MHDNIRAFYGENVRWIRDLNNALSVEEKQVILNKSALGLIPMSDLRGPFTNLATQQGLIQNALDTLFGGF